MYRSLEEVDYWDKQDHHPFGNSVWEVWSTFQLIQFSRENFPEDKIIFSFSLHPKFQDFFG